MLRVLHIEDNPGDRELVRLALARSGIEHELRVAADEVSAQLRLAEAAPPHLLLVDINLSAANGLQLLARRERYASALPHDALAAVLSSSQAPGDVLSAREAGAHYYCVKPASFGQLAGVCQGLLQLCGGGLADLAETPGVTRLQAPPAWVAQGVLPS